MGQRPAIVDDRTERLGIAVQVEIRLRGLDDPTTVALRLVAGRTPRGDAMATEDHADRFDVRALHRGDVEAELEAGAPPRHPHDPVAVDVLGQLLTVDRRGDGDAAVGVQMVDMCGGHERVHGGVDRRRCAAGPVATEIEQRDHLVLARLARIHVDERPQPVEAKNGEAGFGERAEIAAGSLHPQQLDVLAGDGVDVDPLR